MRERRKQRKKITLKCVAQYVLIANCRILSANSDRMCFAYFASLDKNGIISPRKNLTLELAHKLSHSLNER